MPACQAECFRNYIKNKICDVYVFIVYFSFVRSILLNQKKKSLNSFVLGMFTYMEINLNDTIRPLSHATYEIISYYVRIRSASEWMKQPTNKLPTGYSNFFASFQVFSIEYYTIFHYNSILQFIYIKTNWINVLQSARLKAEEMMSLKWRMNDYIIPCLQYL